MATSDLRIRAPSQLVRPMFGMVASARGHDHLGGGLAVDRVVHLVLHRGEELLRERVVLVVVDARGVDVGDLLVESPLAGADVLDAAGQLVEVVVADLRVLQALVVQHEALDDVLLELVRGPLAEAHGRPGCAP